jgi:hypothetical protein
LRISDDPEPREHLEQFEELPAAEPVDTFHVENLAPNTSDIAAMRADATSALT